VATLSLSVLWADLQVFIVRRAEHPLIWTISSSADTCRAHPARAHHGCDGRPHWRPGRPGSPHIEPHPLTACRAHPVGPALDRVRVPKRLIRQPVVPGRRFSAVTQWPTGPAFAVGAVAGLAAGTGPPRRSCDPTTSAPAVMRAAKAAATAAAATRRRRATATSGDLPGQPESAGLVLQTRVHSTIQPAVAYSRPTDQIGLGHRAACLAVRFWSEGT
jgi:hypothetical protein